MPPKRHGPLDPHAGTNGPERGFDVDDSPSRLRLVAGRALEGWPRGHREQMRNLLVAERVTRDAADEGGRSTDDRRGGGSASEAPVGRPGRNRGGHVLVVGEEESGGIRIGIACRARGRRDEAASRGQELEVVAP